MVLRMETMASSVTRGSSQERIQGLAYPFVFGWNAETLESYQGSDVVSQLC